MKAKVIKLVLGLFIFFYTTSVAQQNFFNVPSSDITPMHKVFFQQQLNIVLSNRPNQSSTTFCYGLGKGFEIGVNLIGVSYNKKNGFISNDQIQPFSPFYCVNAQKKVTINKTFSYAFGSQLGTTATLKLGHYMYTNWVYKSRIVKLIGGLYQTSDSYFGPEQRSFFKTTFFRTIGIQSGLEWQVLPDKLTFQTDFISGKHSVGELVLGGVYYVSKHWTLSCGYQIPTFKSQSQKSLVIELTYTP